MIKLIRMGKDNEVFVIPSLVMYDPNCDNLIEVMNDLRQIIDVLGEYFRDII